MGRFLLFSFLIYLGVACEAPSNSSTAFPWDAQIDSLLQEMSLEQKIGQTALRGTSSRGSGVSEALKQAVREGRIGAMLNVMAPEQVDELQRIAVEESPQGIPLIFARDVIHGFKTIFPIPLGIAASWDPQIAENCAQVSAYEATAVGVRWTFAPMLDIARDSRWGRIAESPGEDPLLASDLGAAYVRGFQGPDLTDPHRMAACAKHFVGYGAAIGGRDYNTTIIHEALLRDVYLPPFLATLDAGAPTVMTAFNEINGIPASGNTFILNNILRQEWDFQGIVVSDWNSVTEMIPHGYAADEREAALLAAQAKLDLEMTSQAYDRHLLELIEAGEFSEQQLDELVRHILHVKFSLGLFDQPFRPKEHTGDWYAASHLAAAKEAAISSTVLLQNNGVLPLAADQKVALIGPLADAPREQLGTWVFDGEEERSETLLAAFAAADRNFQFVPGLKYSRDPSHTGFAAAIQAAKAADVIVFVGGEEAILSGEAHSRANIDLPGAQKELLAALAATGKPLVLIIMAGRPITYFEQADLLDGVLMAWHPGTMGGPALEEILFGVAEPQGRLPVTWPKTAGQLPLYYNHKNTGRPPDSSSFVQMADIPIGAWQSSLGNQSHYLDAGYRPHFPFGFGLSYADLVWQEVSLKAASVGPQDSIQIQLSLENRSDIPGTEVVQIYIQDLAASLTQPVRVLKAYQKIRLQPKEQKTVSIGFPASDLAFYNNAGQRILEPGKFRVFIGPNASRGFVKEFELTQE